MLAASKSGKAVAAGAATDQYFPNTVLLLNDTGTNGAQNNTFIDSSTNNFGLTRNGSATQGTYAPFSKAAGYWSNYFNGTNTRLTIADNANLRAGTSTFTLEAWVYRDVVNVAHTIFAKGAATPTGFVFGITSSNTLRFTDTSTNIDSTGTIPANTWTYVAVVREGTGSNQLKLYINGTNDGMGTSSTDFNQTTEARIGENRGATEDFNGYISNLRFVIGTAIYTSNFTPSTIPLTAITNTRLLTCQSNFFVDNSSNNFTLTLAGTPLIQPSSPFAPTSSYSISVNGGSLYFNGSTDYISNSSSSTAFNFGTGDFTVEYWIYPLALATITGYAQHAGGATNTSTALSFGEQGGFIYATTSVESNRATSSPLRLNEWSYVTWTRSGTTHRVFKNGILLNTFTRTTNVSNSAIGIGATSTGTFKTTSYISNVRVINGTALYTSNFTPPTAPTTAVTNTSLLLNATNAGIYDATALNDMVTVGNAQVSTTEYKWSPSSMYFDGTGDWLLLPSNVNITLNEAVFTIEGWIYLNAVGSARGIVGKGTGTTGWLLSINSSNQVVFTDTTTAITSTGTLSVSTWYHIAVVRSTTGTNQTKIYINGTNDGTGTSATNFSQTNSLYVGADRTAGSAFNGYIEDLRITKGVARYTANFTAPTAAFPTR